MKGVHDVYFVFRGTGYNVASWAFSEKTNPELPDLSARPTVEPVPTMNPNVKVGWNADKTEYAVPITEENIVEIKKILEKVCPFVPEVVTSKLGAEAPIIGGIKVALDYAEEQIIMLWKS